MEEPRENSPSQPGKSENNYQFASSSHLTECVNNSDGSKTFTAQCRLSSLKSLSIQILAKRKLDTNTSLQCIVYKKPKKMPKLSELEKIFEISTEDIKEDNVKEIYIPIRDKNNKKSESKITIETKFLEDLQNIVHNNPNQSSATIESKTNHNLVLNIPDVNEPTTNNQNSIDRIDLTSEDSNDSNASNTTMLYESNTEYMTDCYSSQPSTSNKGTQYEIISNENVILPETPQDNNKEDSADVEIVENVYETIVIDDELPEVQLQKSNTIINIDDYIAAQNALAATVNPVASTSNPAKISNDLNEITQEPTKHSTSTIYDGTNNTLKTEFVYKEERRGLGDCPICIEPLIADIASTKCGHVFCIKCLKTAIQKSGKKCPKCRKPLRKPFFNRIYL